MACGLLLSGLFWCIAAYVVMLLPLIDQGNRVTPLEGLCVALPARKVTKQFHGFTRSLKCDIEILL